MSAKRGGEPDEERGGAECRICKRSGAAAQTGSRLVWPCECRAPVHVSCLQKWVGSRPPRARAHDDLACEVCHARYRRVPLLVEGQRQGGGDDDEQQQQHGGGDDGGGDDGGGGDGGGGDQHAAALEKKLAHAREEASGDACCFF